MLTQELIDKATEGNEAALLRIYCHYKEYIRAACTETIHYADGRREKSVNSEMEGEIITHLFIQIIKMGEKNGKDTSEHK